jgi:hypothetical protein
MPCTCSLLWLLVRPPSFPMSAARARATGWVAYYTVNVGRCGYFDNPAVGWTLQLPVLDRARHEAPQTRPLHPDDPTTAPHLARNRAQEKRKPDMMAL